MAKQNAVLIFITIAALVTLFYTRTNEAINHLTESHNPTVKKTAAILSLDDCKCHRITDTYPSQTSIKTPFSNTTCSAAHRRGEHQKVIAFSYYEKSKGLERKRLKTGHIKENKFLEGLLVNLKLLPQLYPGILDFLLIILNTALQQVLVRTMSYELLEACF